MKRIAMFMPGGVGAKDSAMHVPALVDLIEQLSSLHDVVVYSLIKPDGNKNGFRCGNAEVKFIDAKYDDSLLRRIGSFLKFFRHDHRHKPFDVLHGFWAIPCGLATVLAGKIFRIPSIVSLMGAESASIRSIGYGYMRKQPQKYFTLKTCEWSTHLTTLTRFQLEKLQAHGFKRNDVQVFPFGAQNVFFREPKDARLHSPLRILHVGSLNKVKDQSTLLRTFQRISERIPTQLTIVGSDQLNGEIHKLADSLGLSDRVDFKGYITRSELPRFFAEADILLHTSLYEAQGVVIAEAAANGLLLCGTNVGLLSDLGDDCCVTSDVGDYHTLAEKILQTLPDREMIARLRSNAFSFALNHPSSWTTKQFSEMYVSISEKRLSPIQSIVNERTIPMKISSEIVQ